MTKNTDFELIILPLYFFFSILSFTFQHYEYTFTDINNKKEYEVFSEGKKVYIRLENEMLIEGQFPDFEIQNVYEDKNYFIGCDFNNNSEDNEDNEVEKYYIVVDKNKAIMKIYKEQNFKEIYKNENINSVEIYCLTDKEGDEIIEWYKEKLNSTNDAKGIWNNFEMDVSFNKFSNLVSIVLKKQ